jgi:hypothetical protein
MALTKCEECKKEVSTKAKACPHCGAPIKEKMGWFSYLSVGVFLVFFIAVVNALFNNDTEKVPKTTKQTTKKQTTTPQITNNEIQFYLNNIDYRASITTTGNPCPSVTHKFWTGKDETSGKRFVSVSCSNGSNYMVSLPANDEGMIRVTECELMESLTGVPCFEKLNDTP